MFGCIPDDLQGADDDRLRRPLVNLVGATPAFAPVQDLTAHLDKVLSQGGTNSCVAHWFSTALYLAGQASQRPVPRPSLRWAYNVARYMRTPGVLEDLGSSSRLMCLGTQTHGIVSEERFPFDEQAINEPPPFDLDIAGGDALFTGYYRVEGDPANLLRQALAHGHVPGLALRVHDNFLDIHADDGVYEQPEGDWRGDHMVTLVGYRPGAFRLLNSWGTTWADGGMCWISDRFVASHYCFDRTVVTSAPLSR